MRKDDVFVGQWVRFKFTERLFWKPTMKQGFVTFKTPYQSLAQVAVPADHKVYDVFFSRLEDFDEPRLKRSDLRELINIALDTRDFGYLENLRERLQGVGR